jgi:hypothetical protein
MATSSAMQVIRRRTAGSRQLMFLSQDVCDKCQTVHFTWKIQQQFVVIAKKKAEQIYLAFLSKI